MLGILRPLFCLGTCSLGALATAATVSISQVEFRLVEEPRSQERWYEMSARLEVRRGGEELGGHPRFLDRPSVRARLCYERGDADGERSLVFYEATATFVALGEGERVARFYLPSVIVDRDRLRGEPFAWEVMVFGERFEPAEVWSRSLEDEEWRTSFRARLSEEGALTTGALQAQHETPFWLSYPENSPTPLRLPSDRR